MEEFNNKYASVNPRKLRDLTEIYNDYLYMVRVHERYINMSSPYDLVDLQKEKMYPNGEEFPWQITKLNEDEQSEYTHFITNKIQGRNHHTYVTLQHVIDKANNGKPPVFVASPYRSMTIGMIMPSAIERYKISCPQDATFGNTQFYIDGRYKAVYTGERFKDKPLTEYIGDADLQDEFTVMLRVGECLRKNGYVKDEVFEIFADEVYASELLIINENNILEIIGSFAEKVKDICNDKYMDKELKSQKRKNDSYKNILKAQGDGFLNLPENFWDYVNLRNFIRHQWEALEELEAFMPEQKQTLEEKRVGRVNSYLKFGEDSIYMRVGYYLEVLQQMQQVISEINPNRLIRGVSEKNEDFIKRVQAAYKQRPNSFIKVETNYPLDSEQAVRLNRDIENISYHIRVVDDIPEGGKTFEHMFERMQNYKKRSSFLQDFHAMEAYAVGYCIRHGKISNDEGKNLTIHDAFDYLRDIGVITKDERDKWREHTELRRKISHFYFDDGLRQELNDKEKEFYADLKATIKKLSDAGPTVRRRDENIFEYTNVDGKVVVLDHKRHKVLEGQEPLVVPRSENHDRPRFIEKKYKAAFEKKVFKSNRPIIDVEDGKIKGVRFANNVYVDCKKQSINWARKAYWYTDNDLYNSLKTADNTVRVNKNMRVMKYFADNRWQYSGLGNSLLLDGRHEVLLDVTGRIKEFQFKDEADNVIRAEFKRDKDGHNLIAFADDTRVIFTDKKVKIMHGNVELNTRNIEEFKASYDQATTLPPQILKGGNGR